MRSGRPPLGTDATNISVCFGLPARNETMGELMKNISLSSESTDKRLCNSVTRSVVSEMFFVTDGLAFNPYEERSDRLMSYPLGGSVSILVI